MKLDIIISVQNADDPKSRTTVTFPGADHDKAINFPNNPFIANLVKEHLRLNFISKDGKTFPERLKELEKKILGAS